MNITIDQVHNRISRMTANNYHTDAIIEGCKFLGDTNAAEKLNAIYNHAAKQGYMDQASLKLVNMFYKEMMNTAKIKLSEADYKKFHSAF